jgi:hypothetical protein
VTAVCCCLRGNNVWTDKVHAASGELRAVDYGRLFMHYLSTVGFNYVLSRDFSDPFVADRSDS